MEKPASEPMSKKIWRILAPAAVSYVDGGGVCGGNSPCFTTIQSAINAANPGDTINVFAGTYAEQININKALTLNGPNANINPKSAKSILAQRKKLPTTAWKRRMADGDTNFTTAGIQATATLIQEYLKTVADHASKKKAANIHNSVKRVVLALNKINEKHDGFIETVEREELCVFLDEVVRMTGLEVVGDLTEEWRDW